MAALGKQLIFIILDQCHEALTIHNFKKMCQEIILSHELQGKILTPLECMRKEQGE